MEPEPKAQRLQMLLPAQLRDEKTRKARASEELIKWKMPGERKRQRWSTAGNEAGRPGRERTQQS